MNGLKIEYEIDKLIEIVDERDRLMDVLHMQPSKNDNIKLKKHINHTLDLLKDYEDDVPFSEDDRFNQQIETYNDIIKGLPETVIDKELYRFKRKPNLKETKKVRFKDGLVEEHKEPEQKFKPYKDDESSSTIVDDSLEVKRQELFGNQETGTPKYNISPQVSNQDIFIQQQQQLMEQESHLENLSSSINRTHGISIEINDEVEQQNEHLLTDIERQVDRSENHLQRAGRRLNAYETTAREKGSCFLIVILSIILFLLVII
ncbi:Syn8 [Kluyveromyces lactis]|nr:Syn8 [Kluyveromyces lactis]